MKTNLMKPYQPPSVALLGRIELEPGPGSRVRLRCNQGHYVTVDGAAAPLVLLPAPMLVHDATRAIVLHRRLCT